MRLYEYPYDYEKYRVDSMYCHRMALLVPLCGAAGIWSPSCIASAQTATYELNQSRGIAGKEICMLLVNSAFESEHSVEKIIHHLLEDHAIDSVVGMHVSAILSNILHTIDGSVPYIYTPLYEGGSMPSGAIAIGETPAMQLYPSLEYLHRKYHCKTWGMIGNNYSWPRVLHYFAKNKFKELRAKLIYERYIDFGYQPMEALVEEIALYKPDALLVSLVGQDAVLFNRAFSEANLHKTTIRFSCSTEENCLLASGPDAVDGLYTVASYFGALPTEENARFRESYHNLHGDTAPVLNTLGQSTYEGIYCLASLLKQRGWYNRTKNLGHHFNYKSARRFLDSKTEEVITPFYLAHADGVQFHIEKTYK